MIIDIFLYTLGAILLFILFRIFYPLLVAIAYQIVYRDQLYFGYYPIEGYLKNFQDIKDQTNQILLQNPRCKAIITNYLHHPLIYFINSESSGDIFQNARIYSQHIQSYFYTKFMGKGVLYTSGEKWQKQRQVLSQGFHFTAMRGKLNIIKQVVKEVMQLIPTKGQTIQLVDYMKKLTGEVALRSFFGQSFSNTKIQGQDVSVVLNNSIVRLSNRAHENKFLMLGLFFQYYCEQWFLTQTDHRSISVLQQFNKLVTDIVVQRLKEKTKVQTNNEKKPIINEEIKGDEQESNREKDILDLCIDDMLQKQTIKTLTEDQVQEIVHQFTVIHFAGSVTTANLAGQMFFYLASHPEDFEKVSKEIDELFPDPDKIQMGDLNKMNHSKAFILQVLRVSPPVPSLSLRGVQQTHNVNGIQIFQGMLVCLNINGIMRSEQNFPNADQFEPSRFSSNNEDDTQSNFNPAFIPFSSGPRNCIGYHLGLLEAQVILIYFIRTFNFQLHNRPQKKFIFNQRV